VKQKCSCIDKTEKFSIAILDRVHFFLSCCLRITIDDHGRFFERTSRAPILDAVRADSSVPDYANGRCSRGVLIMSNNRTDASRFRFQGCLLFVERFLVDLFVFFFFFSLS
jgi:hypothetical protein